METAERVAGAAGCSCRHTGSWAVSPWPESKTINNVYMIMPLETCLSSFVGVFWCSFSCVATFQQWMTFPYLLELSRKPNSHLIEGAAPDPPKFYSTITTEQQQWAPAQKEAARSPSQRVFAWYGHLFETLLKILEMKKLCLHIITNKENWKKKKKNLRV